MTPNTTPFTLMMILTFQMDIILYLESIFSRFTSRVYPHVIVFFLVETTDTAPYFIFLYPISSLPLFLTNATFLVFFSQFHSFSFFPILFCNLNKIVSKWKTICYSLVLFTADCVKWLSMLYHFFIMIYYENIYTDDSSIICEAVLYCYYFFLNNWLCLIIIKIHDLP